MLPFGVIETSLNWTVSNLIINKYITFNILNLHLHIVLVQENYLLKGIKILKRKCFSSFRQSIIIK